MKPFKRLLIYYFSGTGNSQNVALWMSSTAAKYHIECEVINIADINRISVKTPPPDSLIVFISPVHGFNYPPIMLNFIRRFPIGNNKVLLMNTRAGMLIGKYITPGLSGVTFYLSGFLLAMKGYSPVGMIPVDLPSNWISLHPGLNQRTVAYLQDRNKKRVIGSSENIFSGKKNFKSLREIIQDVIAALISFLYYYMGRFVFTKTNYASSRCTNCGLCIKDCPVKAIIKIDKRPFWTFNCENCMKCMGNCPEKAIETGHGFLIGMIVFNSLLVGLMVNYMDLSFISFGSRIIRFIVDQALFLALLAVGYRIVHFGMRFRIIEKLMVYTSLTHFKFWGSRYKAPKEE